MLFKLSVLFSVFAFHVDVDVEKTCQPGAHWGLARLSHFDYQFNPDGKTFFTNQDNAYCYSAIDSNAYFNSTLVYMLDSGVDVSHPQFEGRATWGANFVNGASEDDNGHGTHLAGIAVGGTVGVARNVSLIAVKVLNQNLDGAIEAFIKAVDWTISHFQNSGARHAVINYSAVGEKNEAREKAVFKALSAGIPVVGAAGNDNSDACQYGPSNLGDGSQRGFVATAALNYTNSPASFTNYGSCVAVYSPGVDIYSSLPGGKYGYLDGTSCAAAFTSGLIAYLWQLNPEMSIDDIATAIQQSNPNAVKNNYRNTTESIIYNLES